MDASFPLPVFTGDAPLYDQLYRHIAGAVQSGALSPGARLPSKRRMCALAGVSMVSRYTLTARSDMASFVDSLVAPLSLVNALLVAVSQRKNEDLAQTFHRLEEIWEKYNVYEKVPE